MAGKHAAPSSAKYTISPVPPGQQRPEVLQVQSGSTGPGQMQHQVTLPAWKGFSGEGLANFVRSFAASSGAIPLAWGASMLLVAVDEWRQHRILARPARLWWTSIAFFILAAVGQFDKLRPIATLLAFGFLFQLTWQFFNGGGQFGE